MAYLARLKCLLNGHYEIKKLSKYECVTDPDVLTVFRDHQLTNGLYENQNN